MEYYTMNGGVYYRDGELSRYIIGGGYRNVGFASAGNEYEYPMWYRLDNYIDRFESVIVDNESVMYMDEGFTARSVLIINLEEISVENLLKIKLAHWNIEMQYWLLDMQLGEDRKSARKDNAVTNGGILHRFCMMVRKYDKEMATKPMKRFLMSNKHDIRRIEGLLLGAIATEQATEGSC